MKVIRTFEYVDTALVEGKFNEPPSLLIADVVSQSCRLGSISHTQFTFTPLLDFPHRASSIVLSPDHTVIVTSAGLVYTFGLNRFSQLGYPIDVPTIGKGVADEPIQASPKRVVGVLKKEEVIGAACSRIHTVVFTSDSLYTFGTNKGQLGYSTPGTSVQIQPRKVTMVNGAILMVTATESATACLMETKDVLVLHKEGFTKIVFPMARFPREMQTYRPPQVGAHLITYRTCTHRLPAGLAQAQH